MKIYLNPLDNKKIKLEYKKAIKEASELYILTAFLTKWDIGEKLNKNCKYLTFVVGTDFGTTRKAALKKALNWLPPKFKTSLYAADDIRGFHPKLLMWKTRAGNCNILIGSSNLTQAAFSSNYEANANTKITIAQYERIRDWIYEIVEKSQTITYGWIKGYEEAKQPRGKKKREIVTLKIPQTSASAEHILKHRDRQKKFEKMKQNFTGLVKKCAQGIISNAVFYDKMKQMWKRWGLQSDTFKYVERKPTGKKYANQY